MTVDWRSVVAGACERTEEAAGLQAALVFGSVLWSEHPRDLDLALLWEDALAPFERWKRANRLAGAIEHGLGAIGSGRNVDVKDLRRLPLPLQYRVLREGEEAWVADRRALVRFRSEVVPRALDFLPSYRRALRAAASRLARVGR